MPEGEPHEGLEQRHLEFTLKGERLKARFDLVRLKDKGKKSSHPNWLLIKGHDEHARPGYGGAPMRDVTSVVSGLTVAQMAKAISAVWHSNRRQIFTSISLRAQQTDAA